MKAPVVLVVEDYPDAREMMCIMLGFLGYAVAQAADGARAVEKAVAIRPDLILMDISLPVMDGFQATTLIRRQPETRDSLIIACTAHNPTRWRQQALDAGCNGVLHKPVDFNELEQLLSHYVPLAENRISLASC